VDLKESSIEEKEVKSEVNSLCIRQRKEVQLFLQQRRICVLILGELCEQQRYGRFWCQLSICSSTDEDHGKGWPVAEASECSPATQSAGKKLLLA
jgi:hypothetical protein